MTYAVIYEHGPNEEGREMWSAYVPVVPFAVGARRSSAGANRIIAAAAISLLGTPFRMKVWDPRSCTSKFQRTSGPSKYSGQNACCESGAAHL
jgi:hypothetical protein